VRALRALGAPAAVSTRPWVRGIPREGEHPPNMSQIPVSSSSIGMSARAAQRSNPGHAFRYEGYELDASSNRLVCHYALGTQPFIELIEFDPGGDWGSAAVHGAARLVFLLSGISYYKAQAPLVVDLGDTAVTAAELELLRAFYVHGLGELAYRNGIDLSNIEFRLRSEPTGQVAEGGAVARRIARPLVPFGGGIDSIVTVETIKRRIGDTTLFVASQGGIRFQAIEAAAAVSGLPIRRADRSMDEKILRSEEFGFLRGHVPVTGILSAIAVMAAALHGHDAVVMSNEWSASEGNLVVDGQSINHQYSKSASFEVAFRRALHSAIGDAIAYFSLLRPFSELRVAQRFAELDAYHRVFHSCNRAFRVDPHRRLEHWCGECDKCCFIDLILSPFLGAAQLDAIFDGLEPLTRPALRNRFQRLLGTAPGGKPFECVGAVAECRAALQLCAARPDRAQNLFVQSLLEELPDRLSPKEIERLLAPFNEHWLPDGFATEDFLG